MTRRVVTVREETAWEKQQREWFEKQVLASPDNLEQAARLLIGLVTGLLGVLFGVLTITKEPLPAYLRGAELRWLGAFVVVLLLAGIVAALAVVMPWRRTFNPFKPSSEAQTFAEILRNKSSALAIAAICFGAALILLGVILVAALLTMA